MVRDKHLGYCSTVFIAVVAFAQLAGAPVRAAGQEDAQQLFADAKEKCLAAEKVKPGDGAYNLACIAALQSDEQGCREWLEKSKQFGTLPNRSHMVNDPDLEAYREREWFKKLFPDEQEGK